MAANTVLYWATISKLAYPEITGHEASTSGSSSHAAKPKAEPKKAEPKKEDAKKEEPKKAEEKKPEPAAAGGDDEFDMFSEVSEEEQAAEKKRQEDAKATKKAVVGRSNIILNVKTWGDETDFAELEKQVRAIQIEGCTWGPSKVVPVAYTIKMLQISCVVIDELVSVDDLEEKISALEDVQSVDVAAFVKV